MAADPITTPRTIAQLTATADQQAQTEIAGQVNPLQSQENQTQAREGAALGQIGSMFDQLQPIAQSEADRVQGSYGDAVNAQHQIFAEATQRMDQLRQARAAEAQQMAQTVGGPVAVGEFTSSVDPAANQLASVAPNALMHGLANAEAGVQEASAFSGRVLPALRAEQTATARSGYEQQIKDLADQITKIQAQGGALKNSKLNDLIAAERDFELKQAGQKLDQVKADRDWAAAKHQLANDDKRLHLAQKQFGLSEAGVTGKYKGKPTIQAVTLSVREKEAAQRMGLSVAQYQEMVRHHTETEATSAARVNNQATHNAMSILDAATGSGKAATVTNKVYLDPAQGAIAIAKGKTNVYRDKNGKYYTYQTVHLTPQQVQKKYGSGFAGNPQGLYDILIGSNIPAAMALKLVRTKTGVSDFSPGKQTTYTAQDLAAIGDKSFNELRGLALARGWKAGPKHNATTQTFIDYILAHQNQ